MSSPSAKRIVVANTIGFGLALLVSFLQAPFLIHQLGDERYGLWSLIGLVTGYYGLLDFGTRGAIGFFVARARAVRDDVALAEITASAFWFLVAVGTAVILIGSVGVVLFPHFFHVPPSLHNESYAALTIALVTLGIGLPLDIFSAVVAGCRRGEIVSLAEALVRICTMSLIFLVLPHYNRLDVLAAINLSGKVVVWFVSLQAARHLDTAWRIGASWFRRSRLREIVSYGIQTFVGNVAGTLVERIDTVVIAAAMGPKVVTFYVIGQSLVMYVSQGVNSITLALTPFFADLSAQSDRPRTLEMFFGGTRAASLATGLMSGGLIAFAGAFLTLWVGPQYVQGDLRFRSDVVLLVLLVATIPRLILSAGHQYLFGTNQQRFLAKIIVIEGIANLTLSVLLVRPLGLAGVAIGSAIPSLICHAWFTPRFLARSLRISAVRILVEGQLRGIGSGVAICAIGFGIRLLHPPTTWPVFLAEVALTTLLTVPIVWRLGLLPEDRDTVRSLIPFARKTANVMR